MSARRGASGAGTRRLALAAVLLAVLTGVGTATGGAPAPDRPTAAAVTGAGVVCPLGPVTAGATGTGGGSLATRALDGPPAPLPLTTAGRALPDVAGPVVTARGAVAAGLAVEHVSARDQGTTRGGTAVRCTAPVTSAWFLGGASVVGQTAELVLVNAEQTPALVDVRAWSATGPVEQRPGRGLPVAGRSTVVVPLDRLAPDRDLLALHVTTSRGRVAPYVRHTRVDGRTPQGVDWVPQTRPPAREAVVPGLPGGPGRRAVVVSNPGDEDALVTLTLTTGDGALEPVELDVPAGTSVAEDVSAALGGTPATARLVSQGPPVLASGLVLDERDGGRDLAWVGAALPLTGPALLADVVLSPRADQVLHVTALDEDASLVLVAVPVSGSADGPLPPPRALEVPAGTTAALRLSTLAPSRELRRLAFELRPLRGTAYASRHLVGDGPRSAVLPVVPSVPRVARPPVEADPLAG